MLILVKQGDKYSNKHVRVLRQQAKETSGLDTIVLGDSEGDDIRLKYGLKGFWAKMELFRPDIPRPFIYVDLDSFILGDIIQLLGEHLVCRQWHEGLVVQSSIMAVNKYMPEVWETFAYDMEYWQKLSGDEEYLEKFKWNFIQDKFDLMVGDYNSLNRLAPVTRVVTFPGRLKQDKAHGWAKDKWESYE